LIHHQWHHPDKHLSIDSAKDFLELTKIKIESKQSGLFVIGGGVPKKFAQRHRGRGRLPRFLTSACTNMPSKSRWPMLRDGALSGSTLKEANSWGKVDQGAEQMVYAEATPRCRSLPVTHIISTTGRIARRAITRKLFDQPATMSGKEPAAV